MRRTRRKPRKKITIREFRCNQQIHAPEIKLIDENGKMVGLTKTPDALRQAQEAGLDLVEVSPKACPPVAKIMDYGRYRYQTEKQLQKQKTKQKKVTIKGVRLTMRISSHDLDVRLSQAKKFLTKGNKVKVEMRLGGRERQMIPLAKEIINKFIDSINTEIPVQIEQPLTRQGGRLSVIILNK